MKMKQKIRPILLLLAFAAGVWAFADNASAQTARDYNILFDRIERIEKELSALQKSAARGKLTVVETEGSSNEDVQAQRAILADMEIRIGQLARELRELTGAVEQILYTQGRLERELEMFRKDVEFRFQDLQSGAAVVTNQVEPTGQPKVTLQEEPPFVLPEGSVQDQYRFAFNFVQRGDLATAEKAFAAFLETHPDDALASNAQYWLGETFYERKNFPKAAEAFLKSFQVYGDGIKGPDSLLKLAMTLGIMEKPVEGCAALAELESRYPNAAPTIQASVAAQKVRLAC